MIGVGQHRVIHAGNPTGDVLVRDAARQQYAVRQPALGDERAHCRQGQTIADKDQRQLWYLRQTRSDGFDKSIDPVPMREDADMAADNATEQPAFGT